MTSKRSCLLACAVIGLLLSGCSAEPATVAATQPASSAAPARVAVMAVDDIKTITDATQWADNVDPGTVPVDDMATLIDMTVEKVATLGLPWDVHNQVGRDLLTLEIKIHDEDEVTSDAVADYAAILAMIRAGKL